MPTLATPPASRRDFLAASAALLAASGKVRLCLSGHMHLLDRVEVDGVTFVCGGAVSGGWWRGPHEPKETAARCPNGYGLVTLRPDGSFTHEYRDFGWKA
jgi:hypothetical protein